MSFPDLDNERIQVANLLTQAKAFVNRLKNNLAPESTDMAQLIAYRETLPDGVWKTQVTQALLALNAVYDTIINEGF